MIEILKMLIPHFSTKHISCYAVDDTESRFILGFCMEDYEPEEDDEPTHVIELQVFLWMGYGWKPKITGGPWRYEDWKSGTF